MAYDRFMVAPEGFSVGLESDKRPWLIPDEAFATLQNAYVFRGRVRKRFGSYPTGDISSIYNSRLGILIGTTDGSGNLSVTVPGTVFAVGQGFKIGTEVFTVYQTGTPAVMLSTGTTPTKTYNTTTGAVIFGGAAAATDVYFYPATPVMGISLYENGPVNDQPTYAFDTQFAYVFAGGFWTRSGTGVTPQWHGTDDNFFWISNYYSTLSNIKALFISNFNATVPTPAGTDDPMWYFNGTNWAIFKPVFLSDGSFVQAAQIIVPFKNRLLLLNTIEQSAGGVNSSFTNRCRFSHLGSPLSNNAFLEPNQTYLGSNADGGGFLDAATDEIITSAEFVKDRLIVYFERSTWEIVFTNNQIEPFLWQKINTELGSEAPFSTVPFDKVVLAIGNTGVHACNGSNVERIDNKIPEKIFEIEDASNAVKRVAGIRDYFNEMVYWTFPSDDRDSVYTYPNRILVYNYQNSSWAFNDDTITSWGYFEQQSGLTWSSTEFIWETADFAWNSGINSPNARQVLAGNQEGFIFIVDADTSRNAPALQITNVAITASTLTLTVINHNFQTGEYVLVENDTSLVNFNNIIYEIQTTPDLNTITLKNSIILPVSGTYKGGATLARVSNINVISKQWNPYVSRDRNVYLAKIDFAVQSTPAGQITVDYFPSSSSVSLIQGGTANGSIMGSSILETSPYTLVPLESTQERLWHPVYFQGEGDCVQIRMYFSDDQMVNPLVSLENFDLECITLFTQPTSSRIQ